MKQLFFIFYALFLFTTCLFAQKTSQQKTLIRNVNLISIDPSRPQLEPGIDVFIENGSIKKIQATSNKNHKGYTIIDGTNKYLIPGLTDMHVHMPTRSAAIGTKDFYLLNLLSGITTIRQMRGKPADLRVRDSINNGLLLGCHTYISTPFFKNNKTFTAQACRDSLVLYKQQGYDFVKYLYGLKFAEYDTLADIAASLNMKLVGHAPSNDLTKAVRSGQRSIEHIDPFIALYRKDSLLFWKTIDTMAAKGLYHLPNVQWYISTGTRTAMDKKLEVYTKNAYGVELIAKDSLESMIKEYTNEEIKYYMKNPIGFAKSILSDSEYIVTYQQLIPGMYRKGIRFLISATSDDFIIPGYNCIDEMKNFTDAGIPNWETIKFATYNSAACLGDLNKWGTITEHKQADMVLLTANPLENIENLRKVEATIINGNVLTHEYLLDKLKKNRQRGQ